jgi:glutathione S-transferase
MREYVLHCFGESGNAYKAALMLQACGLDWEPRYVDFFGGATREPGYRAEVNELGEVPVLDHGPERLSQSGVILTYLAEVTGRYGGDSPRERREILRWILFDNHKFTSYQATLRFLLAFRKAGDTPVTAFLRERAEAAYGLVERHLESRDYLVGSQPTIADMSLAGYCFFDGEPGVGIERFPAIVRWRDRLKSLPGWKGPYDLMPRAFRG